MCLMQQSRDPILTVVGKAGTRRSKYVSASTYSQFRPQRQPFVPRRLRSVRWLPRIDWEIRLRALIEPGRLLSIFRVAAPTR